MKKRQKMREKGNERKRNENAKTCMLPEKMEAWGKEDAYGEEGKRGEEEERKEINKEARKKRQNREAVKKEGLPGS